MRRRAAKTDAPAIPANDSTKKAPAAARAVISLTSDECNALLQIVDVFIKTTGLNGAQPGLVLAARVQQAAAAAFGAPEPAPAA